jgi:glycosyltransferase involved in cell wall biosynthesis
MIKVGVIVPTRGDRPGFLDNLIRMINAQTFQPTLVHLVDYEPRSADCDITQRYRSGYDWFRGMNMDVLALMEDDDWYAPNYLATMVSAWLRSGKPELFGANETIYYHMREFAYFKMQHFQRSSAMSTFIKPDLNFKWCADDQPYTDTHLWMVTRLQKILITPPGMIYMGMKHAVGKSAGQNHNDHMERYVNKDPDKLFLKQHLDPDSFEFYSNYFNLES